MDASTSAQMSLLAIVSSWATIIGAFSSILIAVLLLAFAILGFLVWKQDEMRKLAAKELKTIEAYSKKIQLAYRKSEQLIETSKKTNMKVVEEAEQMEKLVSEAKEGKLEIEKMKRLSGQVSANARAGLATISQIQGTVGNLVPFNPDDYYADVKLDTSGKVLVGNVGVPSEYLSYKGTPTGSSVRISKGEPDKY